MSLLETDFFFYMKGKRFTPAQVIARMTELLTDARKEKIQKVVANRSMDVVALLDGLHDLGNVSAVMRSAEAFGIQEMHIIENQPKYKISKRTSKGTDKWLDVKRWKTSLEGATYLKDKGYKICATSLDASVPIQEIDFTRPTVLVLGNEKEGVSKEILAMSDERCIIPMQGFAQSLNISVAAALCFYHIFDDRTRKMGQHGNLTQEQADYLMADFYMRSADNPEIYF